jgi:hypothetical protein
LPLKQIINDAKLTEEMLVVLGNVGLRDNDIHITNLTGCLRQHYLMISQDYVVRTSKLYPIIKGNLFHKGFEYYIDRTMINSNLLVEKTFAKTYDGVIVTGTPDLIVLDQKLIRDWKVPTSLPSTYRPTHEQQLNLYRWLVAPEIDIDHLEVSYFGTRKVNTFRVPIWKDHELEEFVEMRIDTVKMTPPPAEGKNLRGYCISCPVKYWCDLLEG